MMMTKPYKCPYCGAYLELKDSRFLYGKSYGNIWICIDCDAYVGCHKGTENPLGTPANAELRELRKKCHRYFDTIWQYKKAKGYKNARQLGYKWLSDQLGIPESETHIALTDVDMAREIIRICEPYYVKLNKS
jgi:hypothetical protein